MPASDAGLTASTARNLCARSQQPTDGGGMAVDGLPRIALLRKGRPWPGTREDGREHEFRTLRNAGNCRGSDAPALRGSAVSAYRLVHAEIQDVGFGAHLLGGGPERGR